MEEYTNKFNPKGREISKIKISGDNKYHIFKDKPLYRSEFNWVLSFHNPGVAAVGDSSGSYHINVEGDPVYSKRYSRTFGFYFKRASVVEENNWYHIDLKGNRVYPEKYKWIGNYQEEICTVKNNKDQYFHIDLEGKQIYCEKYSYAGDFKYGVAVVRTSDGLAHHIDNSGDYLYLSHFIDLDIFHKRFARARDSRGWCHINLKGQPIYSERYELVEPFYNGFTRVVDFEGSIGIISENGDWVTTVYDASSDTNQLERKLQGLFTSYWQQQTVLAAVKLNIFESLTEEKKNLLEISNYCEISEFAAEKMLNALTIMNMIKKITNEFELTPMGQLLTRDHPFSLRNS